MRSCGDASTAPRRSSNSKKNLCGRPRRVKRLSFLSLRPRRCRVEAPGGRLPSVTCGSWHREPILANQHHDRTARRGSAAWTIFGQRPLFDAARRARCVGLSGRPSSRQCQNSTARKASQRRRALTCAAGAEPRAASPALYGRGEHGEHPPFDTPEHCAERVACVREEPHGVEAACSVMRARCCYLISFALLARLALLSEQ